MHKYLNECRHGRVVDDWDIRAKDLPERYKGFDGGFDKGCVPFIDRNTYSNFDYFSVMEANNNVDVDMTEDIEQSMQENVHEQMHADMSEAQPVRAAQLDAQQVTSFEQNASVDASMEQPKKRGRPSKQKEKETALSQVELDQISASVDQEMESIFQSVTTAKPLQKQ